VTPAPAPRAILVWMCVVIAVNQLGFGSIVPALALYARSFGVTESAIGLAVAAYGLARFLVAIPIGQLADRAGRRSALALGGLVTAVGNLLCAYAPTYAALVGARFVAGAGAALVITTGAIVLADITTASNRGRTLAIYQGVFLFAVGIGPLPGGFLAEHYGLRAPFVVYAVTGALVTLIAWLLVPETRNLRRDDAEKERTQPPLRAQLRILRRRLGFVLVSAISFVNAVARTGGIFTVIPILARDRLGLSADRIGVGLALASLAGLALIYPAGALADRYGRKAIIVPATILAAGAFMLFLAAPSYGWFLVACVVWSVATGAAGAAPAAYAVDVAPAGMNAMAISAYRMLSDLGYVVGPIALGVLADFFGASVALTSAAMLLAATGIVFARFAPEPTRI
jgi:MFS transporter, DHA1 family, multidrug resistance protein